MLSVEEIVEATRRHVPEFASAAVEILPITTGGSDRHYFRVAAGGTSFPSIIFMEYTLARPDNGCYVPATALLQLHRVAVPHILGHDPDSHLVWLEDLGEADLWSFRNEPWPVRERLYQATLREVAKIHRIPEEDIPEATAEQLQSGFDEALYEWEQKYFFDRFLSRFSRLSAPDLRAAFEDPELAELRRRLAAQPRFLIHRDFQSRNIMVRGGQAYLIDFQGLRPGRPEYDLASLLYDPYVSLTVAERESLAHYYLTMTRHHQGEEIFAQNFADCACQRLMQALGAYGYLGVDLGKSAFIEHIGPAIANLRAVLAEDRSPAILSSLLAPDALELP